MRKCGKIKNPCKICFQTVTAKNGLRCMGACQKWAHFKCLNYTPGKIKDIKAGLLKVNCPCPNCQASPKEEYVHKPYVCGKNKCPANLPYKCEVSTCPINNPSGSTQTETAIYDCPADCPSIPSIGKNREKVPKQQPKEHEYSEHPNQEIMSELRQDIKLDLIESRKSSHCCSPKACYPKKSPPHSMPNDLQSPNDCPLQPCPSKPIPLESLPPKPYASKQSSSEHGPQQCCPTKPRPKTPPPLCAVNPHACPNTPPSPNRNMQRQSSPCSPLPTRSVQRRPYSSKMQLFSDSFLPCPITPTPPNQNMQRQTSPCPAHTNQSNQRMPCPSKPQLNPDEYPIRPPQPHHDSPPLSRPHTPPIIEPGANDCWIGKKRSACPKCCSLHDPVPQKCCRKLPLCDVIDTNDKKCCEKSCVYTNNPQGRKCSHLPSATLDTNCKKTGKNLTLICSSGQVIAAMKSRSNCEMPQYTQYSKGDKICSTSISDSEIRVSTTRSRLSCKMEQLCTTIGEFSEQFKELMCRMMAALDKCR